ncbi:MAG: DUF4233 domain-containing protein [Cellulomonadaceae bacterium]
MSDEPKQESVPAAPMRRKKPARIQFTSTILVLEALVVLFATLVAYGLRNAPAGMPDSVLPLPGTAIWILGGTTSLVLLVLSRLCGRPGGYVAGSLAQVVVVAGGLVVPMMVLVGLIFAAMWVVALRLGGRIDRERAEYDAAHPHTAPAP